MNLLLDDARDGLALRHDGRESQDVVEAIVRDAERDHSARIRCPKCVYSPRKHDRWVCTCGCVWNTFDTRGRCPECGLQWKDTACPRCERWSPHEDWYEKDGST